MAGMGDGYVGTAADTARIRRLTAKREEEKRQFEEAQRSTGKAAASAGLLQCLSRRSRWRQWEQFVAVRESLREKYAAQEALRQQALANLKEFQKETKKRNARHIHSQRLSFADNDEGGDEEDDEEPSTAPPAPKPKKLAKNPNVETSFLPDRERDSEEKRLRAQLEAEYKEQQRAIKNEPLEITYSYWDGTGHRRVISVRKGDTVGAFLAAVQKQLSPEFRSVRSTSVDNLLYIKEDLIIPHQFTFYDLIVNKARGKSGPLFHFDVHDDIRALADATKEKDESHAGKIVERHWYEKNKHIFPASRWEVFDLNKKYDKYTIHGT
eukprot:jgi/Chlat1/5764/Chrsp387S05504